MTEFSAKAAVMGWPIGHSLSPRLHGFWLDRYKIVGSYEAQAVQPEALPSALNHIRDGRLVGANLTVPHKQAALSLVDRLDPVARRIGAVNLVTRDNDGKLLGRNTDAYGFTQNLLAGGFCAKGGRAFVLGAGGASRAVIAALVDLGFDQILIANRTRAHAEKLAQDFAAPRCAFAVVDWADAPQKLADSALLVNTTSLGMKGQPSLEFSLAALPWAAAVTDIVYVPLETDLLRAARERGLLAIDGLGMLLHQARPSFEAFFGRDPEVNEALRCYVLNERRDT